LSPLQQTRDTRQSPDTVGLVVSDKHALCGYNEGGRWHVHADIGASGRGAVRLRRPCLKDDGRPDQRAVGISPTGPPVPRQAPASLRAARMAAGHPPATLSAASAVRDPARLARS